MNIEKYFCRFGHGCNLFCIGTIGDVDQTAVVVLSVTATGHLLVTPLEIAGADKGGVSICVLGIISIGDTPLLLIFNPPQRLGKSVSTVPKCYSPMEGPISMARSIILNWSSM